MKLMWFAFSIFFIGCNGCTEKKPTAEVDYNKVKDELIEARKAEHSAEMQKIKDFIAEKKWPMTQSSTGLYYWIYQQGAGRQAMNNDMALLDYKISLLDGTLVYVTDSLQHSVVRIGMDNVEAGIHEVLLYMKSGDKAQVVLPSHLAFGFTGDSHKIPQNATLVYDLELIELQ